MFHQSYETLLVEKKDHLLTITVNRPDKLNALSETVLSELKSVLEILKNDSTFDVRGVILTGAGDKAFIAGADIKAMSRYDAGKAESFGKLGQDVSRLFEMIPQPVIACVDGFALGGGCEMAMACDFIYATEKAVFGQPEINLALIPGFGGTQRLRRYVGLAKSREMIYTGKNMKAEEAKSRGLVSELYTNREDMMNAAQKTLGLIASKSPLIVAKCKEVIRDTEHLGVDEGLEVEKNGFKAVFETEDKTEGLAAFLQKRTAEFKGR